MNSHYSSRFKRQFKVVWGLLLILLLSAAGALTPQPAYAQATVSGVVNTYAPVTAISGATVTRGAIDGRGASTPFAVGDYVMLIQMTGAPPGFDANSGLGRYEIQQITAVSGSNITLAGIDNSYDDPALQAVQIIRMPNSTSMTVTGNVTAPDWNGATGGVVALRGGTLTLNAGIDVTGAGFQAGAFNGTSSVVSYAPRLNADTVTRAIALVDPGSTDGRGGHGEDLSKGGGGGGGLGGGGGKPAFTPPVGTGTPAGPGGDVVGGAGGGVKGAAVSGVRGGGTDGGGGGVATDLTNLWVFGAGGGGGGGIFGGGGGGGGGSPRTVQAGGGGGGGVSGGGSGAGAAAFQDDVAAFGGGGGGVKSVGAGANAACHDSCAAAGGGAYGGGGGGAAGGDWGGDDSAAGGGGGAWSGGGLGGVNPNWPYSGGNGNTPVSIPVTDADHYLNEAEPRLIMGGSGGSSVCAQGGGGGGIVFLEFNSVGGSSSIVADGAQPLDAPDGVGGSYAGTSCSLLPDDNGAGGAGGGGGGQMRLTVASWSGGVSVRATGGDGGRPGTSNGVFNNGTAHGGAGGSGGGGGGIWFDGVANYSGDETNTGGGNPTVPGVTSYSLGGGSGAAGTLNPKNNLDTASGAGGGNGLIVVTSAQTVSLGSFIWEDADGDGVQDAGEPGIAGATVELLVEDTTNPGTFIPAVDVAGDPVAAQVTGADGLYFFDNLPEGAYKIRVTPPAGYIPGPIQNTTDDDNTESDSNIVSQSSPGVYESTVLDLTEFGEPLESGVYPGDDQDNADNFNGNMTLDMGFIKTELGAIGNYIWLDENSDGYQDEGEPGLANVTVVLYGDPDGDGTVQEVARTVTDSRGGYLFDDLLPGDYYVDVLDGTDTTADTLPYPGMTQTPPSTLPGADLGNQDHGTTAIPDNAGLTGYPVTIGGTEPLENLTADFGYNVNPATDVNGGTNEAAIGDRIWIDSDGDGAQDPNEIGVAGVEVTLYNDPDGDGIYDNPVATTTTDENGNYLFDGLTPDAYVVTVTDDSGASHPVLSYTQTGDPDDFGAPAGAPDNTTTEPVVLGPGDVFLNADFGYQPTETLGTIGDTIWLDTNASGTATQDAGEPGIPGVTVALIQDTNGDGVWDADGADNIPGTADDEPIIATDTTDANGNYLFEGLPLDDGDGDADYIVTVTDTDNVLDGLTQTYDQDGPLDDTSATALSAGTPTDLDQDFSYTPEGQDAGEGLIGDTIFFDADPNDGEGYNPAAGDTPIEGVVVQLIDPVTGDVLATTTTDENGNYYFPGLDPAGEYTVTVAPENFDPGGVLEGMSNTADPNGDDNNTSTVNLAADPDGTNDGINLDQDFGYRATTNAGSIGNLVWEDLNADGNVDAGEAGIEGVTIDLYRDLNGNGVVDPGEPLMGTETTAADGSYLFDGLPYGDYVVDVTDEAGVLNGYWHSLGSQDATTNGGNDPVDESKTDPFGVSIDATTPDNLNVDFGYYVDPAAVGNYVWVDTNSDGIQQATEPPVEGVKVQLEIVYPDGTTTTLVTTTDANGYYAFPNLLQDEDYNGDGTAPEPTFTISVDPDQAPLLTLTETGVNTDDGTTVTDVRDDSNLHSGTLAQPVQGLTDTTAVDPVTGEPAIASYDFGYEPALALGGTLWDDSPGSGDGSGTADDGIYQPGEAVLDGVTVKLYAANPDGSLGALVVETTTDANGTYLFDDLEPGDYIVVVEDFATQTGLSSSAAGAVDPDSSTGDTDTGDENGTSVQTLPVTLEVPFGPTAEGSEPTNERENGLLSAPLSSTQDGRFNYHLDLGFTETPLAVALSYAYGERTSDGMVYFIWETATETSNAGFNLFLEAADGSLTLVNAELVPSSVVDSVVPTRYTHQTDAANASVGDRYVIEMVKVDGGSERYGPYDLGVEYGEPTAPNRSELVNPIYLPVITVR